MSKVMTTCKNCGARVQEFKDGTCLYCGTKYPDLMNKENNSNEEHEKYRRYYEYNREVLQWVMRNNEPARQGKINCLGGLGSLLG